MWVFLFISLAETINFGHVLGTRRNITLDKMKRMFFDDCGIFLIIPANIQFRYTFNKQYYCPEVCKICRKVFDYFCHFSSYAKDGAFSSQIYHGFLLLYLVTCFSFCYCCYMWYLHIMSDDESFIVKHVTTKQQSEKKNHTFRFAVTM